MSFSFRLRFTLPEDARLGFDGPTWEGRPPNVPLAVTLSPSGGSSNIRDSRSLVLRGSGLPSEEEARRAGQRYYDTLMLSLVRVGVGADFGTRHPHGVITAVGLAQMKEATGRRFLQDRQGLMVYETEPTPLFASFGADAFVTRGGELFARAFTYAATHPYEPTDRERLALDLYNASHFEKTAHARFLMLVMAVEALLEPAPRCEAAQAHVAHLINLTDSSPDLTEAERNSLRGSLRWLVRESISQAGRRLASERLGTRQYLGRSAGEFFTSCYGMRSAMVHGNEAQPTLQAVSSALGALRQFVSDLLTVPLFGTAVE